MITAIIPITGKGQRFIDAGYSTPKHLLPLGGKPIIAHILDSLPVNQVIVTVMGGSDTSAIRGINRHIIEVNMRPDGPLASVLLAANEAPRGELIINYCDNFLPVADAFIREARNSGKPAAMTTFNGDNEAFTLTPSGSRASGIYWFRDIDGFLDAAERLECSDSTGIPAVIYSMEDWFEFVTNRLINTGTPDQYESACRYYLADVRSV